MNSIRGPVFAAESPLQSPKGILGVSAASATRESIQRKKDLVKNITFAIDNDTPLSSSRPSSSLGNHAVDELGSTGVSLVSALSASSLSVSSHDVGALGASSSSSIGAAGGDRPSSSLDSEGPLLRKSSSLGSMYSLYQSLRDESATISSASMSTLHIINVWNAAVDHSQAVQHNRLQLSDGRSSSLGKAPAAAPSRSPFADLKFDRSILQGEAHDDESVIASLRARGKAVQDLNLEGFISMTRAMDAIAECCRSLVTINFQGCQNLNDDHLSTLSFACADLLHLNVSGCAGITDAGLEHVLSRCRKLEALSISGCPHVSGRALQALASFGAAAPSPSFGSSGAGSPLLSLDISYCGAFKEHGLELIARYCPRLQRLDMSSLPSLTNRSFMELMSKNGQIQQLRIMLCDQPELTAECLKQIGPSFKKLSIIDLTGVRGVVDDVVIDIARHLGPRLNHLSLAGCSAVSNTAIRFLAELCGELTTLDLTGCEKISFSPLQELASSCRKLKSLDVSYNPSVSEKDVLRLMEILPTCRVIKRLPAAAAPVWYVYLVKKSKKKKKKGAKGKKGKKDGKKKKKK